MNPTQLPFPYNRANAQAYALQWAIQPNPAFFDYSPIGGDCTNFVSQVLYAGGMLMNNDPLSGWYYHNANQKSPSWTGVNFLYQFLTTHQGRGPIAVEVPVEQLEIGDLIQLSFEQEQLFQHSLVVTGLKQPVNLNGIYISCHTPNQRNVQLTSYYNWAKLRTLHILGSYP